MVIKQIISVLRRIDQSTQHKFNACQHFRLLETAVHWQYLIGHKTIRLETKTKPKYIEKIQTPSDSKGYFMRQLSILILALFIGACTATTPPEMQSQNESDLLSAVLEQLSQEHRARFEQRHPKESLEFFEVKPSMTVLEALPGGGWYSKILLPYLGNDGHLIGADYAEDMYPLFGFFSKEQIAKKATWTTDWPLEAQAWKGENGAAVSATTFATLPTNIHGTVDVALFVRALHNLARFEDKGGYLTTALQNTYDALRPGGIVGVIQHEARPETADDWANGSNGYLKKAAVIAHFEKAGFEFVAASDINANPKDQPSSTDIVWRLPPSYATSKKDAELKAKLKAIGESNRMTLKFRKPK